MRFGRDGKNGRKGKMGNCIEEVCEVKKIERRKLENMQGETLNQKSEKYERKMRASELMFLCGNNVYVVEVRKKPGEENGVQVGGRKERQLRWDKENERKE